MGFSVAVLEDDIALREDILVPQLAEMGFEAEGFATSADLYRRMLAMPFELIVLDVRLADEDGLEVARYLRATSPIGIVTLTGRGSDAERIQGLTETVDAWLTKPVEIGMLAATLHSVARRMRSDTGDSAGHATSGRWHLGRAGWRLHAPDGRALPLNILERRLLARLLAADGEVVAHDELIADLAVVAENFDRHRLEVMIHRLRRKVVDQLDVSLPLRAVRGFGYVMLATDERTRAR
jgi:DNA-binding response OmpR family regulator